MEMGSNNLRIPLLLNVYYYSSAAYSKIYPILPPAVRSKISLDCSVTKIDDYFVL